MSEHPPVRVRMAPAPSGTLHVGSLRTALFNWLYARKQGGVFVLRIEDTDAERATDESMHSMLEAFRWVGLDWDEGPEVGGDHGPYRQSERSALYREVAARLEEAGHTYRDYRTREEFDAYREQQKQAKLPPAVKASASRLSEDGAARLEEEGRPYTLRLALPEDGELVVDDLVRGEVRWEWSNLSDPVLVRSDGSATYPLANTTDDVAHGVSLICRGEDLLSATPVQVYLHGLLTGARDGGASIVDAALASVGFPARDPSWGPPGKFAHLSMIVGADRKKLSKRHGSIALQEFARQGFLPETVLNYVALLGWAPGDGRERMDLDEIAAAFSFDGVGKSAAMFDVDKMSAFNGERIRALDPRELADRLVPFLDGTHRPMDEAGEPDPAFEPLVAAPPTTYERAMIEGLVPLVQERMQRLDEIQAYARAFFRDQVELDGASVAKVLHKPGADRVLRRAAEVLADVAWDHESIEAALRPLADELGIGFGKVAQPIRVAVTGSSVSPPLFESLALLDRKVVTARIEAAMPVAEGGQHEA
ncbi:MAG TPA: glutamate--tRNA ligase family protein [Nitriliruptorales bacterium]